MRDKGPNRGADPRARRGKALDEVGAAIPRDAGADAGGSQLQGIVRP